MSDPKYLDQLYIVFTKHDANGLYFLNDDALIIKLTITSYFVRRILLDTGSFVDNKFLSKLRQMKYDKEKIAVIGKVVCQFPAVVICYILP